MSGTDRTARVARVMRVQGRCGLVVAAGCLLGFGYQATLGDDDARTFVFLWLLFAGLAGALSAGVLSAARAVERGGRVTGGVVAEVLVLLLGAWAWPLFPLTVAVPVYVLFQLGRAQPQ